MDLRIPSDLSRSIKVIGAGQSRTGSVSFSMALERLLQGPVCHSGSACLLREEAFIKKWISIMKANPSTDDAYIKDSLRNLLQGFVGVTDNPGIMFTGELVQMFPEALVICTVRERDSWFRSIKTAADGATKMSWLSFLFWPIPTIRLLQPWIAANHVRAAAIYNSRADLTPELQETHVQYLKRVVPENRLFFFNVKEGWGPLCKILGFEIPEEPFPSHNSTNENREFMLRFLRKAAFVWTQIILVFALAVGAIFMYMRNRGL